MKIGIRKPSPERSIKARTTGRLKRKAKSTVNPFYGKKGMGYLKDPERAVKNKIYHKVTIDPLDSLKHRKMKDKDTETSPKVKQERTGSFNFLYIFAIASCLCSLSFIFGMLVLNKVQWLVYAAAFVTGLIYIIADRKG